MIFLELPLIAFVVIGALFVAFANDTVGAIVTFAGITLGVAVIWVLLAAPDVALIEAAIGAGVISVLFVIAVVRTVGMSGGEDRSEGGLRSLRPVNLPAVAVLGALAIPFVYTILSLPEIGAASAPAVSETYFGGEDRTPYGYYIQETLEDTGFTNAVVAVLVVYRGLDTLGELIVAFAAAVSILVVLERGDLL